MMQTEGEIAGAGAAGAAGIPFSLSTMGTTSIEDVGRANPDGRNWFQLYMWKDRDRSMALVDRAAAAGFDTLLVTVDVPVAGARLRDKRNGISIPPALTLGTVLNAMPRPHGGSTSSPPNPSRSPRSTAGRGTVAELLDTMFDPTVTFEDLAWIKEQWPGKLVVKGVQNLADARELADMGVDGIVLSNHGGRQLDRAPIPFHLLPEVAARGRQRHRSPSRHRHHVRRRHRRRDRARRPVHHDRPRLPLRPDGRRRAGVDRAIAILSEQVARTMRLLGVTCLEELSPAHVRQLVRLAPRPRQVDHLVG